MAEVAKMAPSKQRPRTALASSGGVRKTQFASGLHAVDPDYIWNIIGNRRHGFGLYSGDHGRYENKMREVNAKINAMC